MQLTGKTYDFLKFITQIVLPALGALYFGLAGIWGLPSAEQVVGTIVVIDTFLGVVLQISSSNYTKREGVLMAGAMTPTQTPEGMRWTLEFDGDPGELSNAREVHFRVNKPD